MIDTSHPHFERLKVFAYVQAEKASLYRAMMRVFVAAKTRFVLHLRPEEIASALQEDGLATLSDDELHAALTQLGEWGNLEAHPDTADVSTVEDFYRQRLLYRLSAPGEAAERALAVFHQTLDQPGELKTAALADIRAGLAELVELAAHDPLDEAKVHRSMRDLSSRFEELTSHAQRFIGSLQRTIDLHGIEVEGFLAYKEMLIDYLERFIGELVLATNTISGLLRRLEERDVERLLTAVAERDLVDAFEATDEDRERTLAAWRGRWQGLRGWFIGHGQASQAEILRARARAAIPALLAAAQELHYRHTSRSDRTSDLRILARWFAELDRDADAHRLWRAAFALTPARHLTIDAASLEARELAPVSPQTSWLEAPPLRIAPRLRQTGRYTRRGRPAPVIDRRREKEILARLITAESVQLDAARARLKTERPVRLSELGHLAHDELQLFLDLLGEALTHKVGDAPVEATSSDGALRVTLVPTGDGATATISTSDGRLSGPDHFLWVSDAFANDAPLGDKLASAAILDQQEAPR